MAWTRATGMEWPSATRSGLSGWGSGIAAAQQSRPSSRAGALCTVKSPGVMPSRPSHGTGNETGTPGRTRGLYAATTLAP
jgi:hypothetical protein